jgi:hypothetical protein
MLDIYLMKYYSAIKETWNYVICNNIDGPGGHHIKWNKTGLERQASHELTLAKSKNSDLTNLIGDWLPATGERRQGRVG